MSLQISYSMKNKLATLTFGTHLTYKHLTT